MTHKFHVKLECDVIPREDILKEFSVFALSRRIEEYLTKDAVKTMTWIKNLEFDGGLEINFS